MKKCKFEIAITKSAYGNNTFQCARDCDGWAYIWKHDTSSPCIDCSLYVKGTPVVVDRELKSNEFWEIAGGMIENKDWDDELN